MRKLLVLVLSVVTLGVTASNTFARGTGAPVTVKMNTQNEPSLKANNTKEPLSSTIKLPSGKTVFAPIITYLPTEDGWLGNINEGLQLAKQQNKKIILLYALSFRNNHGMTKGYLATYYVEQPQFKNAIKDKYIPVYYWQNTITSDIKAKYNIMSNSQMDMILLNQDGKEIAREQSQGADVNYLVNFVNSIK